MFKVAEPFFCINNTGSIRHRPYWSSRKNSFIFILVVNFRFLDLTSENQSLKSYIDKLMVVLMDKYPDALEATMAIDSVKDKTTE
jgi:hypothetical protein